MSAKKLDLGGKLRASLDERRKLGNIVPEDQIPGAEASSVGDRVIPIDLIDYSPYQPRILMDPETLEALADSIREIGGLIQPIVVRQREDGRYELVAGERRLRAFRMCGYREIPAIVRHLSDADAYRMCVTENLQRENLSPYEIAKTLKRLKDDGICANNSELSRLTGIGRANIIGLLHFHDLPEAALLILDAHPGLIGGNAATDLAKFVEAGHANLVVQAIERVRDGKTLNTRAADWVAAHLRGLPPEQMKREFADGKGRRIGTLSRGTKRISIHLEDDELMDRALRMLEALLSEAAQGKPAP